MLRRLWRQGPAGQASAESIRNKKRVVKMVLVVIVIFALSWLPIQVVLVLRYVIIISGWVFMKMLGYLILFWKFLIQCKIDLIFSHNFQFKSKNFAQVKGQIISKCLLGVFNFFQKTNKNTLHSSKNEFIFFFFGRIHGLTICFRT